MVVRVMPGRRVDVGTPKGERVYRAGEFLNLPAEEAEGLIKAGVVEFAEPEGDGKPGEDKPEKGSKGGKR